MEIYEKVRKYLYNNIGHLTTAGMPRFDNKDNIWKVPVLCKTDRGVIVVGEFHTDKDGNFVNVPTKEEMMKIAELQTNRLPFLYYGTRKGLNKQKVKPVTI